MDPVRFRYASHFVVVPVRLGDLSTELIFDSGIGITVVSDDLAAALGCERTGDTFRGRRMSGQEVEVPLAKLPSLELGGRVWRDLDVAIFDMGRPAGMDSVAGFLSLSPFDSEAVAVDYPARTVTVGEASSLSSRTAGGIAVPVEVERDGRSVVVYARVDLPGIDEPIRAEVDMGSDSLILDTGFAGRLGIDLDGDAVASTEGIDETGNLYTRYFTKLGGVVRVTTAPAISQADPDVMFQRIIHDGLLGAAFLRRFPVTFDLSSDRLLFGSPGD